MTISVLLAAAALAAPPSAFADPAAIDREIALFSGAEPGQSGGATGPVDRRLHLQPCAAPLALSWYGQRRDAVRVQCPDPGSWHLFVPVGTGNGAVGAAPVILRGETVTIEIAGDGFSVSQPGEAMEAGAAGAWIRVRSAAGRAEPMRAQVIRPGLVSVPLP